MSFLSDANFREFLEERIRSIDDAIAREHAVKRFGIWRQQYLCYRLVERAAELLTAEQTQPKMLYLRGQADLNLLHALVARHHFDTRLFRGFLVADELWSSIEPDWFTPFSVFRVSDWQDRESTAVLTFSDAQPFRAHGADRGNDYLEQFIDLSRFSNLAEIRQARQSRSMVLYVEYRRVKTIEALAEAASNDYLTVALVPELKTDDSGCRHTICEPHLYLWPLVFKHLDPDVFHINVGWGTQGVPFMPFVSDPRRAVVDFYDTLVFIPDAGFDPRHSEPRELTRASEGYLWNNFKHFVHRCSDKVTRDLQQKFPDSDVASVIEYVREPVHSQPSKASGELSLVYGGLIIQDADDRDSMFYHRFQSMADFFAKDNMHVYVYPSPYLYGFGPAAAVEELAREQGLTNVHACEAMEEDEWIQEISEHDYGICIVSDTRPSLYPHVLPFKLISYLRAGLPVVVPEDQTLMVDLVRKYNIGVVYGDEDRGRMSELLNSQDVNALKENVARCRLELGIDKAGAKVAAMYERILAEVRGSRQAEVSSETPVQEQEPQAVAVATPLQSSLDLRGRTYLSEAEYTRYLEARVEQAGPDIDRECIAKKFQKWAQLYHIERMNQRAAELLGERAGQPFALYLDGALSLHAAAGLLERASVQDFTGFKGFVVEDRFLATLDARLFGSYPVYPLSRAQDLAASIFSLSGQQPNGWTGACLVSDYRERFIDLRRFERARQIREGHEGQDIVLYPLYREIHTAPIMANFIRQADARLRTVSLSPAPLLDAGFDEALVEPFHYLWPLIFQIADPNLVHLHVGWGIQALPLSPFVPDRKRTVVDFYEVLSSLPDAFFEKTHSSGAEVRAAERHFFENYDHVVHLGSDEMSARLKKKYGTNGSIVSVTEYLHEPTYNVPHVDHDEIRLVYGGAIVAANSPDNMYYDPFLKVVRHFTRDNLRLYIYNSPYLNGTGENDGLKEIIREHGLTNVHACRPLKMEEFVRAITQYDFGAFLLKIDDMHGGDTYNQYMATKFLTYLRAGLPILIHAENRFMAGLTERYNIGVVLQENDLENLPHILNHTDLTALKDNVLKFRHEFSIEKGGAKVLKMYHEMLEQAGGRKVFPVGSRTPSAPEPVEERRTFDEQIASMARADNRLYYRDQSSQTMASLARQARELDPTVVVELGTLAGLSLRTWVTAAPRAKIYAVDLSFQTLRETLRLLPADLSRVTLLEQDILKTNFPSLWTAQDKIIFFVDAHDLPGVPIMEHVLTTALPSLPDGSIVIVDDLWFSPERLTRDNAQAFLDRRVVGEIDELQCFEGHYAPYQAGGSFMGFAEVIPLLKFVNAHGIPLMYEEGGKHVSFVWKRAYLSQQRPADAVESTDCCGCVVHNPLTRVPVAPSLQETMRRIATDYRQKKVAQARGNLADLVAQYPRDPGLAYGLAVCFARRGGLAEARDVLGRIIQDSNDPHCHRLFDDLVERVGPCPSERSAAPTPRVQGAGLTIFAMPKPFVGHNGVIQKNAIRSWARLDPAPEIILFGDEPGIREMAQEVGARHEPDVERNEFGTPLVNKLFEAAQKLASNRVLAYVNADMILFEDFVEATQAVQTRFSTFLLIGRRWDFTLLDEIDFTRGWQESLRGQVSAEGILHAECGLDYFVFTREVYPEIPAFAIGRTTWDNWLVRTPRINGVPVIDGSEAILAVHQDHHYGHVAGGRDEAWHGEEASRNRALGGQVDGYGYTTGAAWALNRQCQLVQVQPRQPEFGSAAYRAQRSTWLAQQARRLMAVEALELAACRWEESLTFLDKLLASGDPEDLESLLLDNITLGERYKAACGLLAQCYMRLDRYDCVVATYTRLLQACCVHLPQEQREQILRVRDQLREHLPSGHEPSSLPSATATPAAAEVRDAPAERAETNSEGRDRRIALIVSMPPRLEGLRQVLASIEPQVDDIRILLNEFDVVPPYLREREKISLVTTSSTGELFASGAWNLLRPEDEGYVFVLDDDIAYPADYVERMIAKIEEHRRGAVVVVHGMDFREPFEDYIRDRILYHFQEGQPQDRTVHAGGVGTSAFHTSTIRPHLRDFPDPGFRDLWFAILAGRQKVPIVCMARELGWLRSIRMRGKELWRMCYQGQLRERKNHVFREHLAPLLGAGKQPHHATGKDFTIFSFTNGRSTYEYSARSLADSHDRQAEIVVLRDMNFLDAVHQCLDSCQTPYFIKVDDDFILHPKAIAYMRQRVLEYPNPEELGIYYCHLWEDWTSRVRQSIKVYRTEALRQIGGFQVDHLGKVDEATKAALRQAGYKVVKDPSVVALHACGSWQEQLEYERLWSSMAGKPYRKPTHEAMKQYCGTKSLEKQYAMRLGVLEFINQQLNTPFDEFLRQNPGAASTVSLLGTPTSGSVAEGGSRPLSVAGSRAGSNAVPREIGARPVTDGPAQISVIAACRNAQTYLPECLESIVGQTMSEWELLLIDDGSTDGTRAIINDYARRDSRIKACCFEDSTGPYIRRNAAIRQARGRFIMIQDADDIMVPHKLQTLYEAISADDRLGIVGSYYWKFLGELRGIKDTEPVVMVTTHEQILHVYQNQMTWDFTWHGSAIIRKSLFEEIGYYDENPFGADSFWLAKAAEYARHTGRIRLSNIPEFLTLRRMHDHSQMGVMPPADPRGRRVRYWQYCLGRLQQVSKQAQENPQMDIAQALRECTCGDFLTRFRAQIPVWEAQPLDSRVLPFFLRRAVTCFNDRKYVTCVRTLRDVETMKPAISQRVVHFNLLRAMALMGLGLKAESLAHIERELDQHNSPAARRFHEDYFQRDLQLDVQQWCAENAERYNLGLMEAETQESPARRAGMNAGQEQGAAL